MATRFDLIYEFVHCRGPQPVVVGEAASEGEARRWAAQRPDRDGGTRRRDPLCDCPVACCALRGQPPRRTFRPKPAFREADE